MIKVKIHNPTKGRNEPTFRPFLFIKDLLKNYHIEITNSDDFDFLFIGMADYYDMSLTLKDSADWGLNNIENISKGGDYFLFDGFDSSSLTGSYEVFKNSKAKLLLKNQLLKNRKDYNNTYAYGKWWFGTGSGLDVSYDISEKEWSKIKLSGFNLGCQLPSYHNHYQISTNKKFDVCAIYQAFHEPAPFNRVVAPGIQYTQHRSSAWEVLEGIKNKYSIFTAKLPQQEYFEKLYNSKICLSPFGQGEICYRDFEAMQFGTLLLKPDQSKITTFPNPYIENETYIPVLPDWSNLNEVIENILCNYNSFSYIPENFRQVFKKEYNLNNLCLYWYELISNLDVIKKDYENSGIMEQS